MPNTASFNLTDNNTEENHSTAKNTAVNLFRPEIEIRNAAVSEAKAQSRTVSMILNNKTEIPLKESGKQVKLEAYASIADRDDGISTDSAIVTKTYTSAHDLGLIDAGAFIADLTLTAEQFKTLLAKQYKDFDPAEDEIPSTGAMIYLRAWITDADGNVLKTVDSEGKTVWTNIGISNDVQVKAISLADRCNSNGFDVSTYLHMGEFIPQAEDSTIATAVAEIKNPSFCTTVSAANIQMIAVLLDKDGNIVSKTRSEALSDIAPETTMYKTIAFKESDLLEGYTKADIADAYIVCSTGDASASDALLDDLTITGQNFSFETLASGVTPVTTTDGGKTVKTYNLSQRLNLSDLSTLITATPENPQDTVKISVNGSEKVNAAGMQAVNAALSSSGSTITITVTHGLVETVYNISLTIPVYGGGGGGGSSANTNGKAIISGGGSSADINVTVKDSKATVEAPTTEQIASVTKGKTVTIDLSGVDEAVNTVSIPDSMFNSVAKSDAETIIFKLPGSSSIELNQTAINAISAQAAGSAFEFSLTEGSEAEKSMNTVQTAALSGMKAPLAIDARIISGTKTISDFNSGSVTISVPYPGAETVRVWYVAEDGTKTLVPSTYDGKAVSFTVSHFSHYVIENPDGGRFSDVASGDYFYNAVNWAVAEGITSGMDSTHFAPGNTTTRAQMVTFLWRAAGSPDAELSGKFTDVASDKYYAKAVAWAVENGITNGMSADTFNPNGNVTRAQAVTFLWRAAGSPAVSVSDKFTDVASGSYYEKAVAWAVENGITTGMSDTAFSPGNACLRAQVVTFLYRYYVK